MKVDAVVLGGGDGALVDPESRYKGLACVGGKPLVAWVVDALASADLVAGIAVVVPTAEELGPWADRVDNLVVSDGSFIENVIAGVSSFRVDRPVLVVTGDLPLLTGASIDDFIRRSLATGADFTYPIIARADMEAEFPGTTRTYIRLADGEVTGGNMMIVDPTLVERNRVLGQALFDTRKSPAAMARILGLRFVIKLALGRLKTDELAMKMTELLGGPGAPVVTRYAPIGLDVDKAADVVLVERMLAERSVDGAERRLDTDEPSVS